MAKYLLLFILVFLSCAPNGAPISEIEWYLDTPFAIRVFNGRDFPISKNGTNNVSQIVPVFDEAIKELGGIVDPQSNQIITIKFDKNCNCGISNCDIKATSAYVLSTSKNTINLCPNYLVRNDLQGTLMHELGHVLGTLNHPSNKICQEGHPINDNIMNMNYACSSIHNKYSISAIEFICSAHKLHGGVCINL